ncbi:MAG: hypothetical protein ABJQ14_12890, partial [Hyphomicrobiales bacterium]
MIARKPVGQGASALKYDLLTAMGTMALASPKGKQRLILRLMTLITARYNWGRDELAVGQREIARMWHVDERTVKREMSKLRALGWLTVKRQGVRGRVTEYGLSIKLILADTQPHWSAVGPDFDLRLSQGDDSEQQDSKIVPLPVKTQVAAPDVQSGEEWVLAQAVLYREDAAIYGAWFKGLVRSGRAGGRVMLTAPTRFHARYVTTHHLNRLLSACQTADRSVS